MKELTIITIPKSFRSKAYNLARKFHLKISCHTKGGNCLIIFTFSETLISKNVYNLSESEYNFLQFLSSMKHDCFEMSVEVWKQDFWYTKEIKGALNRVKTSE